MKYMRYVIQSSPDGEFAGALEPMAAAGLPAHSTGCQSDGGATEGIAKQGWLSWDEFFYFSGEG